MTTETAQQDAIRFLTEQHGTVRELFAAVADNRGDARRDAFEPLVRLLAVHETAEELVIYPTLRNEGEAATKIAEARLAEEDEAKKHLADLEKLDLDSAEFDELFAQIRTTVTDHADAEEREVFPIIERMSDAEQLRRMAAALQVAEGVAPTHPHKTAPESAIGNALVGPFVGMVDRARDAIRDAMR
jgi:hemerythrin superfamily protein